MKRYPTFLMWYDGGNRDAAAKISKALQQKSAVVKVWGELVYQKLMFENVCWNKRSTKHALFSFAFRMTVEASSLLTVDVRPSWR